jgi:hypothetical protein
MFAETFAMLNSIGFSLPTDFTPLQEQQMNQLWHGVVSLGLMTMIVALIFVCLPYINGDGLGKALGPYVRSLCTKSLENCHSEN